MKIRYLLIVAMLITTFETTVAAPLSQAKIKRLIKERMERQSSIDEPELTGMWRGINSKAIWCEDIKISKVKLVKVKKATESKYYYRNEPNKIYANKSFVVHFRLQGSCKLNKPAAVGYEGVKGNTAYQKVLTGRIPLRNTLLAADINNDSGTGWRSSGYYFPKRYKRFTRETDFAYRMKLYKKRRKYAVCLHNRKTRLSDNCKVVSLDVENMKNGSVAISASGLNRTGKVAKPDVIKDDWQSALNRMKFQRGYTPETKALLLSQPAAVKEHIFSTYLNIENSAKRAQFFDKTMALLKSKAVKSNSPKKTFSRSSNMHSHGGRSHTHKLPRQGKAHRHGNGAVGF